VRQIKQLARDYFRGSESFRREIRSGHIGLILERPRSDDSAGCDRYEPVVLKDLARVSTSMQRVMGTAYDRHLKMPAFCAQANLLTGRILDQSDRFIETMRQLHDRSRHT
jgi:hypothetical protein